MQFNLNIDLPFELCIMYFFMDSQIVKNFNDFYLNPYLPHFSGITHLQYWGWGQFDPTVAKKG